MAAVMPATAVTSRADLESYLGQSLLSEYFDTSGKRPRRLSTALKTYLVELHSDEGDMTALAEGPFADVRETDSDLWLATDDKGVSYFIDSADDRFALLHTIGHTNETDRTWHRLTSTVANADRCWFPSRMLEHARLGSVIGFRLFSQNQMEGLGLSREARLLAYDLGRDNPPAFRLKISDWATAERDLRRLRETEVGHQASLESINWRQRFVESDGEDERDERGETKFIHDEVWCSGKVTAHGTSWAGHLSNVQHLRGRYRRFLTTLEREYRLRWESEPNRGLRGGPLEISFEGVTIEDLRELAHHIARGEDPFRVVGYVTSPRNDFVVVDGVDLHTGGRLHLELWDGGVRVFLRDGACGNVIPRFMVNFERFLTAKMTTTLDEEMVDP